MKTVTVLLRTHVRTIWDATAFFGYQRDSDREHLEMCSQMTRRMPMSNIAAICLLEKGSSLFFAFLRYVKSQYSYFVMSRVSTADLGILDKRL